MACWIPFIAAVANSLRGPWRPVGDNAHLALESWATFSSRIPLVGQPNELPHGPHDLGPLQYWLLAIPVHLDPARGVLWGAALLVMLAMSLTIEAAYSVLDEMGGLLASGIIIVIITWFPGFATRPEDNPNFALLFFIPTLSICLAVLSGHRKWWPVLVVTASIAAQAHLMFAAASVGLVLIALVTGLIDEFRAKGSYSWLIIGLIAGATAWIAPLGQQFFSRMGPGNMSLLLHSESGVQHVGAGYALKALATLATPSPLWWQQNIGQQHDLFQVLGSEPGAFGLVILVITAAELALAVGWLRSRELAGLAGISLLVSLAAIADFAFIPGQAAALVKAQHDLVFILFAAVLLAWLTAICVTVLVARKLIKARPTRPPLIPLLVRGAATLLIVIAVLFGAVGQVADYPGVGTNSARVSAATAVIDRSLPSHPPIALLVTSSRPADRFQVLSGLRWALVAYGYHYYTVQTINKRTIPAVTVDLHGRQMTVRIYR